MIRHLVFFKFKPETTQAQRDDLLAQLRALPDKIATIESFELGLDIIHSPRSFDLALVSTFADTAALVTYAKHPDHTPVVERAKEICDQIASVDYEY